MQHALGDDAGLLVHQHERICAVLEYVLGAAVAHNVLVEIKPVDRGRVVHAELALDLRLLVVVGGG